MVEGEMNCEELEVDDVDCVLSRWIAKEKINVVYWEENTRTKQNHIYIFHINILVN